MACVCKNGARMDLITNRLTRYCASQTAVFSFPDPMDLSGLCFLQIRTVSAIIAPCHILSVSAGLLLMQ